jgi:hypothetical protein
MAQQTRPRSAAVGGTRARAAAEADGAGVVRTMDRTQAYGLLDDFQILPANVRLSPEHYAQEQWENGNFSANVHDGFTKEQVEAMLTAAPPKISKKYPDKIQEVNWIRGLKALSPTELMSGDLLIQKTYETNKVNMLQRAANCGSGSRFSVHALVLLSDPHNAQTKWLAHATNEKGVHQSRYEENTDTRYVVYRAQKKLRGSRLQRWRTGLLVMVGVEHLDTIC